MYQESLPTLSVCLCVCVCVQNEFHFAVAQRGGRGGGGKRGAEGASKKPKAEQLRDTAQDKTARNLVAI